MIGYRNSNITKLIFISTFLLVSGILQILVTAQTIQPIKLSWLGG